MPLSPPTKSPVKKLKRAHAQYVYEALLSRASQQEALMWQVPALAMTAQAFLLTISLSPATLEWFRLITGVLGMVISAASMQLMARHHQLHQIDIGLMYELEDRLRIPHLSNRSFAYIHGRTIQRWDENTRRVVPKDSWWRRRRSYVFWQASLGTFLATNTVATIWAAADLVWT